MSRINKVSMLIFFIIISLSLISCQTRLERIQKYINNNDYSDAVNLINEIQNEGDKTQAINLLKDKTLEIKQEFLNGSVDGTRAIATIQNFKSVNDMDDFIDKNSEEITSLMNSQKAFLDGERAEKDSNYDLAYESYYDVIQADTANYQRAQAKLLQIENTVKNSTPISVEKAVILINSKTNKVVYPDQMQVLLKNNSKKTISKFTISILGFNKNGEPAQIQGKNSNEKDYEFLGSGSDINLNPNEVWGKDYGWSLDQSTSLKTIIACVINVEYSDGTLWTNPLYKPWLDQHKQKLLS
ncbi:MULTISPECIES: DUF5780 domain-containing protein [unclassified Clostridium]|uniref:DUF5780 domain-containing protein n=1 Tax=unclassified Clostridium TaxID=2614128 RepID=UPI000297C2E5|nr:MULTISPECIES: DUF5780 domain-containing protein [unclassified Clostridium]EKQ54423.1 MAG: hypothetical protein A370_03247 [Clostridium sp. Maddingley MBC34-26]